MTAPKAGPTPGPWVVVRYTGEVTVEAPCGRLLYFAAEQSDENAVDDAYLIAAVHDLRDALQQLYNACRESGWPLTADHMAPMNAARAALAKAVQP